MRESGDPELIAEYEKVQDRRFEQEQALLEVLEGSGRLKEGLSPSEALAIVWAMSGTELHQQLVSRRQWSGSRYKE